MTMCNGFQEAQMIKRWLSVAVLSGMSFLTQAYCIDDWACFEKIKRGKTIEYWLSNNKPYPITSTLDLKPNGWRQWHSGLEFLLGLMPGAREFRCTCPL